MYIGEENREGRELPQCIKRRREQGGDGDGDGLFSTPEILQNFTDFYIA